MGEPSYQNLKEYHPGYWLAGDRGLKMFEKNSWEKPAATAGGLARFDRLILDQFNFSITRI
jgi:hypothetical protein